MSGAMSGAMTAVREWLGPGVVALLSAAGLNSVLSLLEIRHQPWLVALLVCVVVATGWLLLTALDAAERLPWTRPRSDAEPDTGEDTRTAMYRHVIEVHFSAHDRDETVVWQLADLAARRLRQVHGIDPADDPDTAAALLGEPLASWVAVDRRDRYRPDHRYPRHTLEELTDAVSRIERL